MSSLVSLDAWRRRAAVRCSKTCPMSILSWARKNFIASRITLKTRWSESGIGAWTIRDFPLSMLAKNRAHRKRFANRHSLRGRRPRLSPSCKAATCIAPFASSRRRAAPNAAAPLPRSCAKCAALVAQGVKEVTLLGQIVNLYGRHEFPRIDNKSPFVQLLEAVHEIDGLERLRFTSPHPIGFRDDLITTPLRPCQSLPSTCICRCNRARTGC